MTYPVPASSVGELLDALAGIAHVDDGRLVIDDERPCASVASTCASGRPRSARTPGRHRGRALDHLGGVAAARRAVGEHPRPVHGTRPGRGQRLHGAGGQPAHPGVRHGRRHVPRGRRRSMPARSSSSWRGASRSTPSSGPASTSPACSRAASRPAGRARCSSRATTTSSTPRSTRPTPRRRPRPPAPDPRGARGRLRQHRHRLVDAGRPVAADRRRAAAHQLRARGRAVGAHPRGRAGRADGQHRRRDRRGRQAELDRGGAARLPRRLPARARRARRVDAPGLSKVSVQTGTSHGGVPLPGGGVAEVKLDFGTLERLSAVAR